MLKAIEAGDYRVVLNSGDETVIIEKRGTDAMGGARWESGALDLDTHASILESVLLRLAFEADSSAAPAVEYKTIQDRVLASVTTDSEHIERIAARLDGVSGRQCGSALKKLAGKGVVERARVGYYRLPTTASPATVATGGLRAYLDEPQREFWRRQFTLLNTEFNDNHKAARIAWARTRAEWPETATRIDERE